MNRSSFFLTSKTLQLLNGKDGQTPAMETRPPLAAAGSCDGQTPSRPRGCGGSALPAGGGFGPLALGRRTVPALGHLAPASAGVCEAVSTGEAPAAQRCVESVGHRCSTRLCSHTHTHTHTHTRVVTGNGNFVPRVPCRLSSLSSLLHASPCFAHFPQ